MSSTDPKTYEFNALTAEQFMTATDKLMDFVRKQAVSLNSQPQTSDGKVISENVLLIPIQVVQNAISEAHRLGFEEGESRGNSASSEEDEKSYDLGYQNGFKDGEAHGIAEAKVNPHDEGYDKGYSDGVRDGYAEAVADADVAAEADELLEGEEI